MLCTTRGLGREEELLEKRTLASGKSEMRGAGSVSFGLGDRMFYEFICNFVFVKTSSGILKEK